MNHRISATWKLLFLLLLCLCGTSPLYGACKITTGKLPDGLPTGKQFEAYNSGDLQTAGCTAPVTWSISAGSLPPGLSLGAGSGPGKTAISGTPSKGGVFLFTLKVVDKDGNVAMEPSGVFISTVCKSKKDAKECVPPKPTQVLDRKDVDKLTDDELKAFRKGVKAMMDLSAKDPANPLGWKYQAYIHGTFQNPLEDGWDCCQHSTWFFLSWHRMQIYYFERILRSMSGNDKLTVPYWNFTKDTDPEKRKLPKSFRNPGPDKDLNPLYFTHRQAGLNDASGAPAKPICAEVVQWKDTYGKGEFSTGTNPGTTSFGGRDLAVLVHAPGQPGRGAAENQPHDSMHLTIGKKGDFESMFYAAGAGLDPIFWPMHVNMDRMWSCWNQKNPNKLPGPDTPWSKQTFKFFDVDPGSAKGWKEVCLTGAQIVDTATKLGYKYTDCDPFPITDPEGNEAVGLPSARASGSTSLPPVYLSTVLPFPPELGRDPVTVTLDLPTDVQHGVAALLSSSSPESYVVLNLQGIHMASPMPALYEVYINLPETAELDWKGRYYVGLLSFFGIGQHHHHGGASSAESNLEARSFDLTPVVRRLAANKEWRGDKISITFVVAQPDDEDCVKAQPPGPEDKVGFDQLSLEVSAPGPEQR